MPTKSGQIVWKGNGFYINRLQNSGVSSSGVQRERVFEDGNPKAVGTLTDTPTLTYDMESWDLTTDIEALILGLDPSDINDGDVLDFADAIPLDVLSQWRKTENGTAIVGSMVVPALYLETASYRFGVRQNAGETFSFRGDAQYVQAGSAYREDFAHSGAGPYSLAHTAMQYVESGASIFVLSLCWTDDDGTYQRLFHDLDYTDTNGAFTLRAAAAAALTSTSVLHAVYASSASPLTVATNVLASTAVKAAAIKSQHIDLYISDGLATPTMIRWDGVQSLEVTRRVGLTAEQELGNPHYVSQDSDIPDVTGNIVVRSRSIDNLLAKISQATGVPTSQVAGLLADTPLELEARISNPNTGALIKTLYVDDARITVPPIAVRANTILDVTFPFQSEQGDLAVIKGERAA